MDFLNTYVDYIWQSPKDYYNDFTQATIDHVWEDTTQLRSIKEQSSLFSDEYTEYEAHVTTVSEFIVNTSKISGDYIKVLFKDIDHALNHRGQKYLYKPDGISENVYLCYDKLNPLTQTPDFKCIRCNNHLTMIGEDGEIIKEPCSIGYEITSTNNNVTKDATISQRRMVLLVQGNDNTKDIQINQRFIFQHKQAYKITEMDISNQEDYNDEVATMYKFYIEWSAILPDKDNLELNIADYYDYNYTLLINSTDLSLLEDSSGQLTSIVKLNDITQSDISIEWSTSDSEVVTIDNSGNYQVTGLSGSTARITCNISDNENVSDYIDIAVADISIESKEIIINPDSDTTILQGSSLVINYGVYEGNNLTSDIISVTKSGATTDTYSVIDSLNKITITNIKKTTTKLKLTFSSGVLDSKTIELTLGGIM